MLEAVIADFYAAQQGGRVQVRVGRDGNCFVIGEGLPCQGTAYTREEIEWAAIATCLDVEYVE